MASISKSFGYNVGKGGDPTKPRPITYKGERRSEKWPRGVTERFVDLQGNVVTQQLIGPGLPATTDAINSARTILHDAKNEGGTVQGFVEHGKCPLRHGIRHLSPLLEDEFAAMPAELQRPCAEDPSTARAVRDGRGKLKHIEYAEACPHVEWLIQSRREREAERLAARRVRQEGVLEIEKKKLAAIEAQAEEQRVTNARLLEAVQGRGRKASAE